MGLAERVPKLLSTGEAARRFRVHPNTIRRWRDEGLLPSFRTPGGHTRVTAADVENLIAERTTERDQ